MTFPIEISRRLTPFTEAPNSSGLLEQHTFASADTYETLIEFEIDWRKESTLLSRRFLLVNINFRNVHAATAYYCHARISEDGNPIEDKTLNVPASSNTILELFTRQPPIYKVKATYKIEAKVGSTSVSVVADQVNSYWKTQRDFEIMDGLRQEYNPNMANLPIWTTPTLIPHFSIDELRKGWNWWRCLESCSEAPSIVELPATDPFPRCMKIPNGMHVCGLHNILYGQLAPVFVKWGISPQVGASRSVGFDFDDGFQDFIGFRIVGTAFKAISKLMNQKEETTLTWDAAYATTWTKFEILWRPNSVEFYINETLVAVHTLAPDMPAGLAFRNADTISGNFLVGHFELENCAGLNPLPAKSVKQIINVASIAAGGEAHADLNLFKVRSIALTVYLTYDASATAGARVYLLASMTSNFFAVDSENTTDAFTYFDIGFAAGATRHRTVNIDVLPRFIRVLVRNLDGTYALSTVDVRMHIAGD